MHKLGIVLVVSIVMFISGAGIFTYEISRIHAQKVDISKETQTMTTDVTEPVKLYTKTFLESIGNVSIIVDKIQEDDTLQDSQIVIEYPKMLHVVQEEDALDLQMDQLNTKSDLRTIFEIFQTKTYKEYVAKNDEIHIRIRYGKGLKDKITLVDDYY